MKLKPECMLRDEAKVEVEVVWEEFRKMPDGAVIVYISIPVRSSSLTGSHLGRYTNK